MEGKINVQQTITYNKPVIFTVGTSATSAAEQRQHSHDKFYYSYRFRFQAWNAGKQYEDMWV